MEEIKATRNTVVLDFSKVRMYADFWYCDRLYCKTTLDGAMDRLDFGVENFNANAQVEWVA